MATEGPREEMRGRADEEGQGKRGGPEGGGGRPPTVSGAATMATKDHAVVSSHPWPHRYPGHLARSSASKMTWPRAGS